MRPTASNRRQLALVLLAFAVLTGVLYAPSLSNEFVNWDDPEYVVRNPEIQQPLLEALGSMFSTSLLGNYNPLHRLSYYIDWQLSGGQAWFFRLVSLLLHVLNAGLVYLVLHTWLRRQAVALIAAGLFLILPANVENVAWISERKTLLATLFGLGSMALWLRARPGLALASFSVGLLAKTSIIVLPGLLLLLDLQQRRKPRWGWYAAFLVPAVLAAAAQMLADATKQAVPLHGGTLWSHGATALSALPSYVAGLALPFGHMPKHLFEPVASWSDGRLWLGVLTWTCVAYGMWRSWRGQRLFLVAGGFALAALHLTLIVPIPIIIADRYLYLASPLLLGVVVAWLSDATAKVQRPAQLLAGAWAVVLMVGTSTYAGVWKDSVSLWSYEIEKQPDDRESWASLAAAYGEKDDLVAAAKVLLLTVQRFPDFTTAVVNLAMLEVHLDRPAAAIARLEALLEADKTVSRAWNALAIACSTQGKGEAAAAAFAAGRAHCPADLDLAKNSVQFHLNRSEWSEARAVAGAFGDAQSGAALQRMINAAAPR